MTDQDSAGALAGVRIADFSRVLAAPYATMLLADLGAEVIKVERPDGGDETRAWGPPWHEGESTYFLSVNRNKDSVVIDLRTEEGQAQARDLVASCDVLIENFRTGTMEKFGLGYDDLAVEHPGLVYCSVTGFGSGAGADLPGYDLVVQAVGGLMSLTGDADSGPMKAGVALVDVITGLHATIGIQAALVHRAGSGVGQRVEVNLLSSLLSALTNQASAHVTTGAVPKAMGNKHPSIAPYEVFATADRPLAIAAANDKLFRNLAVALERDALAEDPRFATNSARVAHRDVLVAELEDRLREESADHWFATLSACGVPCGPINDLAQAVALAESLGLDPVVEVGGPGRSSPVRQVAHPIRMSRTPATYRVAPPVLPVAPGE
ncbi:CaiB/BaiF CoA transferase family protein [Nocardioides sp. Root151]|uniref:CaiB/BaiF CoA transferase family protein n=1 Tax=Nocardioides sp. Root151 TaxID=1736475 RepID=UPI000703BCBD|nr:CoA transferase [Nocardioides sp. Root151]KQZ75883.1 carnitine dehydratase [Nocardioides sp. Root151]